MPTALPGATWLCCAAPKNPRPVRQRPLQTRRARAKPPEVGRLRPVGQQREDHDHEGQQGAGIPGGGDIGGGAAGAHGGGGHRAGRGCAGAVRGRGAGAQGCGAGVVYGGDEGYAETDICIIGFTGYRYD